MTHWAQYAQQLGRVTLRNIFFCTAPPMPRYVTVIFTVGRLNCILFVKKNKKQAFKKRIDSLNYIRIAGILADGDE